LPEFYRTPDERFAALDGYDFEPNYLELGGDLEGLRMHYVDVGEGPVVVALHGEPTWSYLYRKMIPILARTHRVIAPDLVGFGRSDKPTDREWYSYERHCNAVTQFIRLLELDEITLLVQDWGGPIGLRVAVENESRFENLIVLNTGLFRGGGVISDAWKAFRDFVEADPDIPVGFHVRAGVAGDLPDQVVAGYEAPFPTAESKAGAAAFPLLVPVEATDPGAQEMMRVRALLARWDKPALVMFSDSDPIFHVKVGRRLADLIPGAFFLEVEGAAHFLQEEKGEEIAETILEWLG
jgi:haloalkane dehalogenase